MIINAIAIIAVAILLWHIRKQNKQIVVQQEQLEEQRIQAEKKILSINRLHESDLKLLQKNLEKRLTLLKKKQKEQEERFCTAAAKTKNKISNLRDQHEQEIAKLKKFKIWQATVKIERVAYPNTVILIAETEEDAAKLISDKYGEDLYDISKLEKRHNCILLESSYEL